LFAGSGETKEEIGKCVAFIDDFEAYAGGDIVILRSHNADPLFLGYALNTDEVNRQKAGLGQGDAVVHINARALAQVNMVIPPLPEQRAIAEALSDVDGLLAMLDKLIAKKRAIKKAAMQQLLTGKTRLPGFSGEWEVKRVADFGNVITGGTPSTKTAEYWDGDIPWVTPTDISNSRDVYITERLITHRGLASIRELPENSVLVTCIASIGKNAILRKRGGCNQQINAVIPNKACTAEFLYYLFDYNKQYLLANAGLTATNIISKRDFSELVFRVPMRNEQSAIATVLSDMDAEIEALERRREKTQQVKQGMMQQLLIGRVRLVNPEYRQDKRSPNEYV
jgi:type I restriction enzyme S subunit